MTNMTNLLCRTPLLRPINRNTSISEAISPCFASVLMPSLPLLCAIITPIFLWVYSRIFYYPKLDKTNQVYAKMGLSILYFILSLAQFIYWTFDHLYAEHIEIYNFSWVNLLFSHDFPHIPSIYGFISLLLYNLISFMLVVYFCFADQHPQAYQDLRETKTVNPGLKSSAISRFFYSYVNPLLAKGRNGKFEFDDLWALDKRWIVDSVTYGNPFWLSAFLVVVMLLLRVFHDGIFNKMDLYGLEAYMNAKTVLINVIYDKMLRLSPAARTKTSAGEFINMITTDVDRIQYFWYNFGELVYAPLNIGVCVFLLFFVLGHNALYGLIILICFIPINIYTAKLQEKFEDAQMEYKDGRLSLMSDVLSGIKVLKLYAWEPSMQKRIAEIRKKEVNELLKSEYLGMGLGESTYTLCPILSSIACFTGYTYIDGHPLTPQVAFVSLMLFHLFRHSSNMLPQFVSEAIRAFVSMRRIGDFLEEDELDESHIMEPRHGQDTVVNLENCTFTWDSFKELNPNKQLQSLNLSIKKGDLVGIVGRVGSGKSSLLSAICGEMHKLEGSIQVYASSVGYVPQQPWIQNKTLRDNVLFQKNFDEEYYHQVIEACALTDDLKILAAGDMTEIGERGINLSGGQKARVSLARAVYQKSDLYILDDTLSAVDSHVGNHIFENVIGPHGLLKNTTRIFALNSISFLKQCDKVVVLDDGKITELGTYDELISKEDGAFAEWMKEHIKKLVEKQKSTDPSTLEDLEELDDVLKELSSSPANVLLKRFSSSENERNFSHVYARQASNISTKSAVSEKPVRQPHITQKSALEAGQLIEEENMEVGKVSWRMYLEYIKAFGVYRVLWYFLVLFIIAGASEALSNIWMARWTSDLEQKTHDPKNLIVYGSSAVLNCIAIGLAGFIFACGAFKASNKFHDSLVESLLKSPMSFFDTTPLGRILNRLSNDMDRIDEELPGTFAFVCLLFGIVFQSVVTIIIVIPELLVVALPLFVFFIMLVRYYTATSVQIRRLSSKSWSLVTSYVQDSYLGADSLRVFNVTDRSKEQMHQKGDMTMETEHVNNQLNRWVQIRLDLLTEIVVFGFIMIAIYLGDIRVISMGILALVITNGSSFSGYLAEIAREWKNAEMNVVAVERINEYVANKHEAPWRLESYHANFSADSWPSNGNIVFKDLCLKYREDTDMVLRHLNFIVQGGEKLGIVGRTGAGKTSLTLALFRLVEPSDGTIEIDGIDIRQIGLHDLRNALTIIPQDPVLFCGTLRSNLDPFDEFSDDEVWLAIEQAHLKQSVVNFEEKLEYEISEGGSNLSVGQRQLICLARALLRKSTKILVLDEATAAVDLETDRLIQESIREYFGHCTILTIAHRLNTILDYDKILVMDAGEARELDSPKNLLNDPNSLFSSLARNAGINLETL